MGDFSAIFHPLYKIFFALGLAPFKMNLNHENHSSPASDSKFKQILSISIIIMIAIASEYGRSLFISNAVVDSKTTKLILALNSYFTGPVTSAAIIFAHWKFANISVDAINSIYESDKVLIKNGIAKDYRNEKRSGMSTVFIIQAVIVYHEFQLNFVTFPRKDFTYFAAIVSVQMASIVFFTIIAQYLVWVSALLDRFVKLNQVVEEYDEECYVKGSAEISKGSELCAVHKKLCEIVDKLAYVYSVPIVLEHGMLFLTLVVDTYFFYRNYVVAKNGIGSYYLASVILTKDIFFVVLLYIVCDKANSIIFEVF